MLKRSKCQKIKHKKHHNIKLCKKIPKIDLSPYSFGIRELFFEILFYCCHVLDKTEGILNRIPSEACNIIYTVSSTEIPGEVVGRPGRRVCVFERSSRRRARRPCAICPARVRGHGHVAVGQPGRSCTVQQR